ncbi:MAG TPA: hypothetical protein VGG20_22965, partial [Thermoanaerobaculia bacterium]
MTTKRIRLIILLFSALFPAWWCYSEVEAIRSSYGKAAPLHGPSGKVASPQASAAARPQSESSEPEKGFPELGKQNEFFLTWAVGLLAAMTALITSTKVHNVKGLEWFYILLGPSSTLLL